MDNEALIVMIIVAVTAAPLTVFGIQVGITTLYHNRQCRRGIHVVGTEWRRGYVEPEESGWLSGVADSVKQERPACRYCRKPFGKWKTVKSISIDSLTLSGHWMDVFDDEGEVWIEKGMSSKQGDGDDGRGKGV